MGSRSVSTSAIVSTVHRTRQGSLQANSKPKHLAENGIGHLNSRKLVVLVTIQTYKYGMHIIPHPFVELGGPVGSWIEPRVGLFLREKVWQRRGEKARGGGYEE